MLFDAPAVLPALLTPFDDRGRVDRAALRGHVEFVIEAGVGGILPCGTTGETALLGDDEVIDVVSTVVEAAGGRVKVVAHAGRPSTRATQRLIERATDAGADAVAAIVPYYHPLEDAQIVGHFRALIETAGNLPLFAYTFPARTGNDLSPAALAALRGGRAASGRDRRAGAEGQGRADARRPQASSGGCHGEACGCQLPGHPAQSARTGGTYLTVM